jgi:hypothetical protein
VHVDRKLEQLRAKKTKAGATCQVGPQPRRSRSQRVGAQP